MSKPVIETTVTSLGDAAPSNIRTGNIVHINGGHVTIAAIDGKAAAIGQHGHRIADHIDHPGMNKLYTVGEARAILGRGVEGAHLSSGPCFGRPVIPVEQERVTESTTAKHGTIVTFRNGSREESAMFVETANGFLLIDLDGSGHSWNAYATPPKMLTPKTIRETWGNLPSNMRIVENGEAIRVPSGVTVSPDKWPHYSVYTPF